MTHSVVDSARSSKARHGLFALLSFAVLPLVVACAGDLDPGFSKGGASGTASGGTSGTGGATGMGGSSTGTGGAGTAVGCDAYTTIFVPKCVTQCHTPGGIGAPLDLSTDAAASKAIGMTQSYPCAADKTSKIINATGPVSGSMILAVSGETCGPGMRMPFGSSATSGALTADEIACIKSYYMAKLK